MIMPFVQLEGFQCEKSVQKVFHGLQLNTEQKQMAKTTE